MAMGYCCILSSFYNRLIFYDDTTTTKPWDWDDENLKSPLKNREELVSASDLNVPTQNYSFHPSCQCVRSVFVFLIHRNRKNVTDNVLLFQARSKSRASPDQIWDSQTVLGWKIERDSPEGTQRSLYRLLLLQWLHVGPGSGPEGPQLHLLQPLADCQETVR